jgi:solute carrier family 13 (sodium-dependent dicarboxylate transporter), member 2/3/5
VQSFHQSLAPAEFYSPAEEAFNRRRRTIGLVLASLVFVVMRLLPLDLPQQVPRMGAVLATVVAL